MDSDAWTQDSDGPSQSPIEDGPSDRNHLRHSFPTGTESLPLTIPPVIDLEQDTSTAAEAQEEELSG